MGGQNRLLNALQTGLRIPLRGGLGTPADGDAGFATTAPGVSVVNHADLTRDPDIFGSQDLTLVTYAILAAIIVLTAANASPAKFASAGSDFKIAAVPIVRCLISGVV